MRDVEPGEIVKLERNKEPKTLAVIARPQQEKLPAVCIFEYVYFARPDSVLEGQQIYTVRYKCGQRLAIESPVKIPEDNRETQMVIVSPVPESSIPAALGFSAQVFNLKLDLIIIKIDCL